VEYCLEYASILNQTNSRQTTYVSKKAIGAWRITSKSLSNIDFDARMLLKLNRRSLPHVANIAKKLINA
jgi:hypothetical protein